MGNFKNLETVFNALDETELSDIAGGKAPTWTKTVDWFGNFFNNGPGQYLEGRWAR